MPGSSSTPKRGKVDERSATPTPEIELCLPFAKLWDKEKKEEIASLPMMGSGEPITIEDPSPTMKDIFGDLHPEGHQTITTSLEGT